MTVKNEKFAISTKGFDDVIDITQKIKEFVSFSNVKEGIINIFVASSVSGLIITEQEPGISEDINKLLSFMIPVNKLYEHDSRWHEGNGFAYIRASFFQKNISIPITNGALGLDKYQSVLLLDFDNKASVKNITLSIVCNQDK